MKKLQNNFTTVEQSKILLELGVPADSADCYLTRFGIDEDWKVRVLNNVKYSEIAISNQKYCLPCWSVGRLIEILGICAGMEHIDFETIAWVQGEWSEKLVRIIMDMVRYNIIDFSELD